MLWDIDGTLLLRQQDGGSLAIFLASVAEATGRTELEPPEFLDGSTDYRITQSILTRSGFSIEEVNLYTKPILAELEKRTTTAAYIEATRAPAPGIELVFSELSSQIHGYATGNTRRRAIAKTSFFGLDRWLDPEIGGFGDRVSNRSEFVAEAIARATLKYDQDFRPIVIGDTPSDVESGKELGIETIAITTGIFDHERLALEQPDLLVDRAGPELVEFVLRA